MKSLPLVTVAALLLAGAASAVPDVPDTIISFESDEAIGSNITCNPAYLPYECAPEHHAWLNALGIDVTGTPPGFLFSTQTWSGGLHGTTGYVLGYAAPNHLYEGGVNEGETLTIEFLNGPVGVATIELVAIPTSYEGVANVESSVDAWAYDTNGALVDQTTLTWTPVVAPVELKAINNPGYLRLSSEAGIERITFAPSSSPYEGLFLESVCTVGHAAAGDVDACPVLVVYPERNVGRLT